MPKFNNYANYFQRATNLMQANKNIMVAIYSKFPFLGQPYRFLSRNVPDTATSLDAGSGQGNYLLLAREGGLDVFSVRGSYAGAIGIPQFMPGSTRRFALDFVAERSGASVVVAPLTMLLVGVAVGLRRLRQRVVAGAQVQYAA
jgi:hypothetical protein